MSQRNRTKSLERLKEALRPWIREDNWSSDHPADEARFNKAIRDSLWGRRKSVGVGQFRKAMDELVEELHPGFHKEYKETQIDIYSLRAAHIESYLRDKKGV